MFYSRYITQFFHVGWFHLHSRKIVQILAHSHFDLVSSVLALDATEKISEMAVELINIDLNVKAG